MSYERPPEEVIQAAFPSPRLRPVVVKPPPAVGPKTGYTAAELMGMTFPEPRFAVEGIVPQGLSILAGRPKQGKSWLALNLGIAVAAGGRAFGTVPVEAGDVLMLDLESNPRRIQQRLTAVLDGQEAPNRLWFETAWPRSDAGGIPKLSRWLGEHPQTRLVVVDTLAKFRPLVRDGGYTADYAAIAPLQELAGRHSVTILVVHHVRKMAVAEGDDWIDAVSGTLGLSGAADGLLGLFRPRGSQDAVLKLAHRDEEEREFALRFDPVRASWSLTGDASKVFLSPERASIVALLESRPPMSPAAVAATLQKNASTTRTLLQKMADAGQIALVAQGLYATTRQEER